TVFLRLQGHHPGRVTPRVNAAISTSATVRPPSTISSPAHLPSLTAWSRVDASRDALGGSTSVSRHFHLPKRRVRAEALTRLLQAGSLLRDEQHRQNNAK